MCAVLSVVHDYSKIDRPTQDENGHWHLPGGQILTNVHVGSADCRRYGCVIHNPSDHHLTSWPMNFRQDSGLMERICPHGVGHPDPDSLAYFERNGIRGFDIHQHRMHGCDGCCAKPYECPKCGGEMFPDGSDYICETCRENV